MLKILQARLQQYMNCELPVVQAGFRKGRENRDQIQAPHAVEEWSLNHCTAKEVEIVELEFHHLR